MSGLYEKQPYVFSLENVGPQLMHSFLQECRRATKQRGYILRNSLLR